MGRHRGIAAFVVLVAAVMVWDVMRLPEKQWSARALLAVIHLYQGTVSPLLGRSGVTCRFEPTCSHYGEAVIRRYGTLRGGWMALGRIARCGPWTPAGTVDLPPGEEHSPAEP
jgi:putative membrane protein insertion efficiency factor